MDNFEKKPKNKPKILTVLLVFLFFLLGAVAGYFVLDYFTSQEMVEKLNDPEYVSQIQEQQVSKILEKLENILLLPEDEDPTIATVIDIEALKNDNPAFYENAKEGDLLIIYSDKAIIFREDEEKIINIAPVVIEPTEGTQPAVSEPEEENSQEEDEESENETITVGE